MNGVFARCSEVPGNMFKSIKIQVDKKLNGMALLLDNDHKLLSLPG
jgi:hypothetical protein